MRQTRYEVRAGEAVQIVAPQETLDFLANAKSRHIEIVTGEPAAAGGGLVTGPNRAGDQILLGASLRTKPGEYTVKLTATSAAGEERQSTLAVEVQPRASVPSGATRPPVVLLNGWETGITNSTCPIAKSASDTFGSLAQYLVNDGVPVVYLFDNCKEDLGQPIETLGNDLGAFLKTIKYDTGAQVPQIDLVGFSMGGLIARAYLAGLQPNQTLLPPTTTLVRKLVLIATPNFGSFVAGNYVNTIAAGSQDAELVPGGAFLWNLATWNQRGDDLRGVDAIAVIGNAGLYTPSLFSGTPFANASDGLVSLPSASLGFVAEDATVTRIVPYCHVDPGAYTNTGFGTFACSAAGIANVNSGTQSTGMIVRSFLAGTADWKSIGSTPANDQYLSKSGGMFFTLVNGAGGYMSDLNTVTFGSVSLVNGGDNGTVFYVDFVSGTGTLTAASASLGTINCGLLAEPLGYTSALRCKVSTVISSVGPLASTGVLAVNTGSITIKGNNFGSQCVLGCKVVATLAGSGTGQQLTTTAWTNTSITANLPASLAGLVTIQVLAAPGSDAIAVMVNPPSTLAVAPTSLQFACVVGGTPAAQSIQITNSASGALNWTATASVTASANWLTVSPASGTAPSTLTVSVSPAGLGAGTYTGTISIATAGATGSPAAVSVTLVVTGTQPAGSITGVANAASFQPGFAGATWVSIFGANLSQSTYQWQDSDFVNGLLPTSLQGVSVTINGVVAYVEYISPTQINVLAPDDATAGTVQVQVTAAQQTSNSFSAPRTQFAPAFFTIGGGAHVAAQHADYSLVGPANLLPGVTSTPAQPGETILLYGTGFGPTNPPLPTSQLVTAAEPLANDVAITIGGVATTWTFAGLVSPGLYQFNVTVPKLPNGDAALVATIGGVATQTGVSVTVQQ